MRIDTFNKVNQLYQTGLTKKTMQSSGVGAGTDSVEISQFGKEFQIAKKAISQASDIRQDKIDDLKQKIASENYYVSNSDIANKLLSNYFPH